MDKSVKKLVLKSLAENLVLGHLPSAQREICASCMERREFQNGQAAMQVGDEPDYFYVVEKGCFVVVLPSSTENSESRGPGQSFGEFELVSGEPRIATVRAIRHSVVWRIHKHKIQDIVDGKLKSKL